MIITRIECCLWEKPTGEVMTESDWDKVPVDILHRAYSQESPLDIGDCLERKNKMSEKYPCAECGTICTEEEMVRPAFSSQFFCSDACAREAESTRENENVDGVAYHCHVWSLGILASGGTIRDP